ncbi:MAG TPA: sigma factor, partial [Candidatus Limnocylindrales bacterium]|nr:sigma factor [Candidatus Limnocylindrales bacterium]
MAFAEIVVIVGDRLYGLAYRVVRDAHVAQDAVQQALLDAWRDLPSLRDAGRFEGWITRLILHSCYEEVGR